MTQTHRMSARLALASALALALAAPASQAAQAQAPAQATSTAEGLFDFSYVGGWENYRALGESLTLLPNGKIFLTGGDHHGNPNDADIFDPATGTYMGTGPRLTERSDHVAVALDNGDVLLMGGTTLSKTNAPSDVNPQTERYRAANNTFTATGLMNLPKRADFTATKLQDGSVLVVGGQTRTADGTDMYAPAELYNPTTGVFTLVGSLHHPRYGHSATLLPDGKVLIAGGVHVDNDWSDGMHHQMVLVAEVYDPASQSFTDVASLSVGRSMPAALLLPNGKVLIMGGTNIDYVEEQRGRGLADLYDPATGTFKTLTNTAGGLFSVMGVTGSQLFLLPSGKVFGVARNKYWTPIALMYDVSSETFSAQMLAAVPQSHGVQLSNGDIYFQHSSSTYYSSGGQTAMILHEKSTPTPGTDPTSPLIKTNTTGAMLSRRISYQATKLTSGKVLISGGRYLSLGYSAEIFDPATQTYTATGSMVVPRQGHRAVGLNDGNALILGGGSDETGTGSGTSTLVSSVEIYHADTNTFTATGSMQLARQNFTATKLQNGDVLIVGGENAAKMTDAVAAAEIYHSATGTFTLVGSLHHSREGHTAHLLPDGTVLIMGGDYSGGSTTDAPYSYLVTAEVYDPTTQTFHDVGPMAAPRQTQGVVNLPDGRAWLIGGISFSNSSLIPSEIFCRSTTEFYDPATGTFSAGPTLPVGKQNVQAFVMPSGNVVILGSECFQSSPSDPTASSSVLIYNPITGSFTTPSFKLANDISSSVLLDSGKILVPRDYDMPSVLLEENTTSIAAEGAYKSYLPALTR